MRIRLMTAAAIAVALAGAVSPAGADEAQTTRGDFRTFAAGLTRGYRVTGHAQMVRRTDGTTFVAIHLNGLVPGETYPVHVHRQPCDDGNADGHYHFATSVPGGAGAGRNEIWPGPVTTDPGGIANGNTTVGAVAGPEALSVVLHDVDGAKIACADLK